MNKLILLILLVAGTLNLNAQVTFTDSASVSKKEKKVMQTAGKRILAFYDWYLTYRKTNKAIPTAHAIIDQNTTARMKHTLAENRWEYEVLMGNRYFDENCTMSIVAKKIEQDKITMEARVKGKYTYAFDVSMIIQQGNWRIDFISEQEDMKPSDEDIKD